MNKTSQGDAVWYRRTDAPVSGGTTSAEGNVRPATNILEFEGEMETSKRRHRG